MKLIVISDFLDHVRGDEITEPALIAQLLASEWSGSVMKVAAPAPSAE